MSEFDQPLVRSQGKPTPQYFNEAANKFEVIKGRDGANSFIQLGTIAMEAWNQTESPTKSFTSNRFGFSIVNRGTAALTFTINGQTREVDVGEAYSSNFEPFTSVTINATSLYKAEVSK